MIHTRVRLTTTLVRSSGTDSQWPVGICTIPCYSSRVTITGPDMDVGIRTPDRADLLDVFHIEKRSFSQPWPYAAFERLLDAPGFLIAERDDEVVGYVVADSITDQNRPIGHIKDIAVDPDYRGRGIGRTLLSLALMRLSAEGAYRVKLEVRESNLAARSLYEDFDFAVERIISNYYDDGEDAYVMVREY